VTPVARCIGWNGSPRRSVPLRSILIQEAVLSRLLLLLSALTLPAIAAEPTLFGRYEQIKIEDLGKTLKAKMDTGAMTASLSARDIERFERDGEDWVRFRLAVEGADDTLYEHRLARIAEIKTRKRRGRRPRRRYGCGAWAGCRRAASGGDAVVHRRPDARNRGQPDRP